MLENELIKYDDNYYVCVSNGFVKANQELSQNETKLLRLVISQVVITDKEFKSYTTTIPELAKIFNVSENNLYRDINNMATNLMRQIIKIDFSKKKWTMFHIFNTCRYDDGILKMELHEEMKPFLLALKNKYTQYQIGKVIGMSSTYAIRLFELIQEKRRTQSDVKFCETYSLPLEEIRFSTNIVDKHKRISDVKKYVLDVAMREITYNAGYAIDYKDIKEGRKTVGFTFELYPQYSVRGRELLEKYGINVVTGMYYKDEK